MLCEFCVQLSYFSQTLKPDTTYDLVRLKPDTTGVCAGNYLLGSVSKLS